MIIDGNGLSFTLTLHPLCSGALVLQGRVVVHRSHFGFPATIALWHLKMLGQKCFFFLEGIIQLCLLQMQVSDHFTSYSLGVVPQHDRSLTYLWICQWQPPLQSGEDESDGLGSRKDGLRRLVGARDGIGYRQRLGFASLYSAGGST